MSHQGAQRKSLPPRQNTMSGFKQPKQNSEYSQSADEFQQFREFQRFKQQQEEQDNRGRHHSNPEHYRRQYGSESPVRSQSPVRGPHNAGRGNSRGRGSRGGQMSRGSDNNSFRGNTSRGRVQRLNFKAYGPCPHKPITKKLVIATMADHFKDIDISEYPWDEITIKYFCSACNNKMYVNPTAFGVCYRTNKLFIHIQTFHVIKRETVLDYYTNHIAPAMIDWAGKMMQGTEGTPSNETTSNEYTPKATEPAVPKMKTSTHWDDVDDSTEVPALDSLEPAQPDRVATPSAEEQLQKKAQQQQLQQKQADERAKVQKEKEEAMSKRAVAPATQKTPPTKTVRPPIRTAKVPVPPTETEAEPESTE